MNVTRLAGLLELNVTVVPGGGHMRDKRYVSSVLDKWLNSYCSNNVVQG